jgi:hypothetical protein
MCASLQDTVNSSSSKRPIHVDAQQSLRLDTRESTLGLLDIGKNGDAALI